MIFEYDTLNAAPLLDPPTSLADLGVKMDTVVTENSTNPVSSGAVYTAVHATPGG